MDNVIISLLVDLEGIIWIGTELGLDRFDPESGIFRHFKHVPGDPYSISRGRVQVLFEDKEGWIWVGTSQGLDRFDKEKKGFKHFAHDENKNPLSQLIDLYQDRQERLLFLFQGIGLCEYNYETVTIVPFELDPSIQENLSKLTFNHMCEDYMGRILSLIHI